MERWEVYAQAVREFIAEKGGYGMNEQANRDRINYSKFMAGKANEVSVFERSPEKVFYYPHNPEKTGDCSDFSTKNIIKETSRLTKYDINQDAGPKLNKQTAKLD